MPISVGQRDTQTFRQGGHAVAPARIAGVRIVELGNVLTHSGWLTEIFRGDWADVTRKPQQINWVTLNPQGVTDWHRHMRQTDHLVGVGGNIKLALWDGRENSPTTQETDIIRVGAMRPLMVIVPPGVWHALRNESGLAAGYINVADQLYDYEEPDNWRLKPGTAGVPDIL